MALEEVGNWGWDQNPAPEGLLFLRWVDTEGDTLSTVAPATVPEITRVFPNLSMNPRVVEVLGKPAIITGRGSMACRNSPMNCPNCSVELPEDAVFCHQCGEPTAQSGPPLTGLNSPPGNSPRDRLQGRSAFPDQLEEPLWSGGYSAKAMVGSWILAAIVSLALLAAAVLLAGTQFAIPVILGIALFLWVYLGLLVFYRKLNVDYQLTTQRFVHQTGILRRVTNRIEAIDMDDVSYEQGLFERIVNVGDIHITSSDCSHPELILRGIDQVGDVAKLIDKTRHKERLQRGLHIEAV